MKSWPHIAADTASFMRLLESIFREEMAKRKKQPTEEQIQEFVEMAKHDKTDQDLEFHFIKWCLKHNL